MIRIRNFFNRVFFKLRRKLWAARVNAAGRLLRGHRAWEALDLLGVAGFGTELLRVDFLSDGANVPAWDPSSPVFARLAEILDRDCVRQIECLDRCLAYADRARTWPKTRVDGSPMPWLDNDFLSPLDMAALYGMIRDIRPARYVEIGSGISTRVALAAIADGQLATQVTCVDPAPRVALPASTIEIRHLQKKMEEALDEILALIQPRSILFFDGSHRSFPGSDVTLFFLNLLPALPSGTIVHIHDIYLPNDYPADLSRRFWSEQYLLATLLLGGAHGLEVLLPGERLDSRPDASARIPAGLRAAGGAHTRFLGFWLRKL